MARFHAEMAGAILTEVGYDAKTIRRVQALLRRDRAKSDPETQRLEDAASLVFLESALADFASRHDEAKAVELYRRVLPTVAAVRHLR